MKLSPRQFRKTEHPTPDLLAQFRQRVLGDFAKARVCRFVGDDRIVGRRRIFFPASSAQGIANRQQHRAAPIAAQLVDLDFVQRGQGLIELAESSLNASNALHGVELISAAELLGVVDDLVIRGQGGDVVLEVGLAVAAERLTDAVADARVAGPFECSPQVSFRFVAGFGDGVSAASRGVPVARFPEGPACNVFLPELLDDLWGFELIKQVLHEHRFLHGVDGDSRGKFRRDVVLAEEAGRRGGLFEGGGLLEFGELALGGGNVGGESCLVFAGAGEICGDARRLEVVGFRFGGVELM